jgi:hypothetical protein
MSIVSLKSETCFVSTVSCGPLSKTAVDDGSDVTTAAIVSCHLTTLSFRLLHIFYDGYE